MLRNKLEPGDMISFRQKDGLLLMIIVHPDGVLIKADNIKTNLKIERQSDFAVKAIAIDKE